MKHLKYSFSLLILSSIFFSCNLYVKSASYDKQSNCKTEKINFDLDIMDQNGLTGPRDGKVAVNYEFCIPNNKTCIAQVFSIDSSLVLQKASGRSACKKDQLLIIGTTFKKDYRNILCELSKLNFINKISRSYGE